jgi:hypothetical protein
VIAVPHENNGERQSLTLLSYNTDLIEREEMEMGRRPDSNAICQTLPTKAKERIYVRVYTESKVASYDHFHYLNIKKSSQKQRPPVPFRETNRGQTHYISEKLVAPRIEPGLLDE